MKLWKYIKVGSDGKTVPIGEVYKSPFVWSEDSPGEDYIEAIGNDRELGFKMLDLDEKKPRIVNYLVWDGIEPIHQIDFTIAANPSLRSFSTYTKGKKTATYYHDKDDISNVVVMKEFKERYVDLEIDIEFTWFDQSNDIFTSKIKTVDLNGAEWEERFRSQRVRVFDDLKNRAKKYGAENYIQAIYNQFSQEKQNFENTGDTIFAQSIQGFLLIDTELMPEGVERRGVEALQGLLNASLDGIVKVYETLIYLTT